MEMFGGKKRNNKRIVRGIRHIVNPRTIAMDIFSTFSSLFTRRLTALADCSPGVVWGLSFKMIMR